MVRLRIQAATDKQGLAWLAVRSIKKRCPLEHPRDFFSRDPPILLGDHPPKASPKRD